MGIYLNNLFLINLEYFVLEIEFANIGIELVYFGQKLFPVAWIQERNRFKLFKIFKILKKINFFLKFHERFFIFGEKVIILNIFVID
jgi:hypothetical protein